MRVLVAAGLALAVGSCEAPESREEKAERLAAEINARCDALGSKDAADQCRYQEFLALDPDELP